ncbi:MAG TPA: TetR/AcrR family transcriptional regulator [Nitrososphaeraceae archaeon]|jgi:AcrR family transcriptional regulator
MRETREQKINQILQASVSVLSSKGYENATIADISKAARVSRGILHYYFTDKIDLASKALAFNATNILKSSLDGVKGESAQEIVDNIINSFRKNLRENPDFYAFLFEMWCASRRSKRIKKELMNCMVKVVAEIEEALKISANKGIFDFNSKIGPKGAAAILALCDGIAFQLLLVGSQSLDDFEYWDLIKRMLLSLLIPD